MRKKIQEIIRGRVETPAPAIILPEKDLQISVIEHDVCQGSFSFYSATGSPIRGLVTGPDPDLICMTPRFEGKRVQILFEYHGKNLEEGDEKDGYFVITSNAGEYTYPYHVHTTRNYAHTSIGWIKTLTNLTYLKLRHNRISDVSALDVSGLFGKRSYHNGDYDFYYRNIEDNASKRVEAYLGK